MRTRLTTIILFTACLLSCSQTRTGAYVKPDLKAAAPVAGAKTTRTIFLTPQVELNPTAKPMESACDDWADQVGGPDTAESMECRAWLDTLEASLGTTLRWQLTRDRAQTRIQILSRRDKDWRRQARPGDLHVKVTFSDTLARDFTWALLLIWRTDTYRLEATVSIEDAPSGRHLHTFDVSQRYKCGLNYLWFNYMIIPLFPFYISSNKDDRAKAVTEILGRVSAGVAQAEAMLKNAGRVTTGPVTPTPTPAPTPGARPNLACVDSKVYVNSATFKGFPKSFFGDASSDDIGAVLASRLQSTFFENGMRDVFTLTNLEQQLKKEKRKAILGCSENACVNRIIENFGLSESVFITVTRMGEKQAYLNLTWMNISSEEILGQQTGITTPEMSAILEAVGRLGVQLLHGRCP